jgi:hypothetical protein
MEFLLPLTDAERSAMGRPGPRMVINTQMRLATAREHKDTRRINLNNVGESKSCSALEQPSWALFSRENPP